MFRLSQRPKGLEFPSCASCNQGTSRLDVVAAYMARTMPGIDSEKEGTEWQRLMDEVERVAPNLLREMHIPAWQQSWVLAQSGIRDPRVRMLRANGPILSAHMQAFAAKIGFALHHEFTKSVVSAQGRVQVRWFTSEEMASRRVPESLYNSIGTPIFLKQGIITSKDEFDYGAGYLDGNSNVKLYYAKVRQSFEVAAFVVEDSAHLPFRVGELATFRPGDLQDRPTDRILFER